MLATSGLIQYDAHVEVGFPGGITAGAGAEGADRCVREACTHPGGEGSKNRSIGWMHGGCFYADAIVCDAANISGAPEGIHIETGPTAVVSECFNRHVQANIVSARVAFLEDTYILDNMDKNIYTYLRILCYLYMIQHYCPRD